MSYLAVDFLRFAPDDNIIFVSGRNLVLFNSEDNTEKVLKTFNARITCIHREDDLLIIGGISGLHQTIPEGSTSDSIAR